MSVLVERGQMRRRLRMMVEYVGRKLKEVNEKGMTVDGLWLMFECVG